MSAGEGVSGVFPQLAARAFSDAGFAPPVAGDVAVLVFDSTAWLGHVVAAQWVLDRAVQQRAARFRFARDRDAYVLAHAMWRSMLGFCLRCEPSAVGLVSTPAGQPQLPGTPWATSLSHSGHWVAMAVGRTAVLGVDIERSPPPRPLDDLVSTICTTSETADMHELPPAARELAMLRLWTRKEALLKAFGTGLSGPHPATLAVPPDARVAPPEGLDCPPCRVHELRLPSAVVGSLALPVAAGSHRLHILGGAMDGDCRTGA